MNRPAAARHPARQAASALAALLAVLLLWHLLTAVWGVIAPTRFPMPLEVAGAAR